MSGNDTYIWQQENWPNFIYDQSKLRLLEEKFLHLAGISVGTQKAIPLKSQMQLKVSFLSDEGVNTAKIEGEILDRESLQSSIQHYFNLKETPLKNRPRETGMAQMMVDLYSHFQTPLTKEMLCSWHRMIMKGRTDLQLVGKYRDQPEPMRIISGAVGKIKVHYEAPPADQLETEMKRFISWFNQGQTSMPALTRAGIAHAYFELIHPFEDGNGRIGRALVVKSLAQSLRQPTLIAISQTIQANKKNYYRALATANTSNEITDWLLYFSKTIIEAQKFTLDSIELLIRKARFFEKYSTQLNSRQVKLIRRIFDQGIKGFKGGVSIKNYVSLTKTSPITANRDLNDLVAKGIMKRTGKLKTTRYWFDHNLKTNEY